MVSWDVPVPEAAGKQLHPDNTKDEEGKGTEDHHVQQHGQGLEQRHHQHLRRAAAAAAALAQISQAVLMPGAGYTGHCGSAIKSVGGQLLLPALLAEAKSVHGSGMQAMSIKTSC